MGPLDVISSQGWGLLIHGIIALWKDLETDPPALPRKGAVTGYCLEGGSPCQTPSASKRVQRFAWDHRILGWL